MRLPSFDSRRPAEPRHQPLPFVVLATDGTIISAWDVPIARRGERVELACLRGLEHADSLTRFLRRSPSRVEDGFLDAVWDEPAFHAARGRHVREGFLAGLTMALTEGSPRPTFGSKPYGTKLVHVAFLKRAAGDFWDMSKAHGVTDFDRQRAIGERYAAQFVDYLRRDPRAPIEGAWPRILQADAFQDAQSRGVRWGWSIGLSRALADGGL